jgi:hypothetical protein
MATSIYSINKVYTVDDIELEISPLKIKYMRELMDIFQTIDKAETDEDAIDILSDCVRISMKHYCPEFSKNIEIVQDNFDMATIYEILDYSVGIKINTKKEDGIKEQAISKDNEGSWKNLDLAKLETEAFLLGIWKDYNELETSMSMPELLSTISSRRELDYEEKKFLAGIQGINLDEQSGSDKGQKEWEDMKARVFSRGQAKDSKDILALQGQNAVNAGFGIGMGLDYENIS